MIVNPDRFFYKDLGDILEEVTSHQSGLKKIISTRNNFPAIIEQIAVGTLRAYDSIPEHIHQDMDEFFFVIRGKGNIYINGNKFSFHKGVSINIPAENNHSIVCESVELEFFYFGVSFTD